MFDTAVVATDGSASAERAVGVALDVAERFDAEVHALYVVDAGDLAASPEAVREELERALVTAGGEALTFVREAATGDRDGVGVEAGGGVDEDVVTAVREGDPVAEICRYADEHDADLVVTGTRGRGGPGFALGSVAEGVIRRSSAPVLTVRQLEDGSPL